MSQQGHLSPSSEAGHPAGRQGSLLILWMASPPTDQPSGREQVLGAACVSCCLDTYSPKKRSEADLRSRLVFLSQNKVRLPAQRSCLHRSLLSAPILQFCKTPFFQLWLGGWIWRRPHSWRRPGSSGRSWSHDRGAELLRSLLGRPCLLLRDGSIARTSERSSDTRMWPHTWAGVFPLRSEQHCLHVHPREPSRPGAPESLLSGLGGCHFRVTFPAPNICEDKSAQVFIPCM